LVINELVLIIKLGDFSNQATNEVSLEVWTLQPLVFAKENGPCHGGDGTVGSQPWGADKRCTVHLMPHLVNT